MSTTSERDAIINRILESELVRLTYTPAGHMQADSDGRFVYYSQFDEIVQYVVELRRVVEIDKLLLEAAKYLLLAAKGREDGPTSWCATRKRWFDKVEERNDEFENDPRT